MPARKPRPDLVDRATVEAMIAEAGRRMQAASKPLCIRTWPTFRKR